MTKIERLRPNEFQESVITAKVNELVDAFNNHYHRTIDSYTQAIGDYDKGYRSSSPRLDTGDDTEPDN